MKKSLSTAFISIGSNVDDAKLQCLKAIDKMKAVRSVTVNKVSSFYRTSPWGYEEQPFFVNAAAEVQTGLDVFAFLSCLQNIEKGAGRVTNIKWGPRIIDLDIIFFNNTVVELPWLSVPHPLMQKRRFVLEPIVEIAPFFEHPVLKKPLKVLLEELNDKNRVEKIS